MGSIARQVAELKQRVAVGACPGCRLQKHRVISVDEHGNERVMRTNSTPDDRCDICGAPLNVLTFRLMCVSGVADASA